MVDLAFQWRVNATGVKYHKKLKTFISFLGNVKAVSIKLTDFVYFPLECHFLDPPLFLRSFST